MVEIPKRYGKIMAVNYPQYVVRTVHKRHYYIVDCNKAWRAYNDIVTKNNKSKE